MLDCYVSGLDKEIWKDNSGISFSKSEDDSHNNTGIFELGTEVSIRLKKKKFFPTQNSNWGSNQKFYSRGND